MKTLVFMLFGVAASAPLIAFSASDTRADMPHTLDGLQVAVGECLAVKRSQADSDATKRSALDAIAGAVISQGVNYIGKALTAAGAAKTWTITGARNVQAPADKFPQCVLVVRGSFLTSGDPVAWTPPSDWPKDLPNLLSKKGLWPSRAPDFIFEGEIIAAKGQSALTIRPVMVTYTQPIGTRTFRNDERSIAVFFAITQPGTKPTLENSPAATIVLGKLKPSTTLRYRDTNRDESSPFESPWFSLTKEDAQKPLTVTAMLSETQDEQAFLSFLGKVFSDTKVTDALNTQLTQVLVPSVAQQAGKDAATKDATASTDADTKFGLAISKLNTCKAAVDAPGAVTTGADARTALRNYMLADAALAAPRGDVQQSTVDKIDLRENADGIKRGCADTLAALMKQ